MSLPLQPRGDRVLIRADRLAQTQQLDSGLVTATTLAAATGEVQAEDSWFAGTVVAVGPLANAFDGRKFMLRKLRLLVRDLIHKQPIEVISHLGVLIQEIERLPVDCPDPVRVGDRVTFSWAVGQQITVGEDRFVMLHAPEILAVLVPEEEMSHA